MTETARLAFHLHWPLDTILDLEHADRRRFLAEAEAMAERRSDDAGRGVEEMLEVLSGLEPEDGADDRAW